MKILIIIVIVLIIIALFLLYKNRKTSCIQHFSHHRIRTPPKLSLVPLTCVYTIIPATVPGNNYWFNGYYYYFYDTQNVPVIFIQTGDGYGGLLIRPEFQNNPVTISWPYTSYEAPSAGIVDTFEIGCGGAFCNIGNITEQARCNKFESVCQFDANSVTYIAIESPTIWPRYYDQGTITLSTPRKNTNLKDPDPLLLVLTITAQYNPN